MGDKLKETPTQRLLVRGWGGTCPCSTLGGSNRGLMGEKCELAMKKGASRASKSAQRMKSVRQKDSHLPAVMRKLKILQKKNTTRSSKTVVGEAETAVDWIH